jgi:prophage regulatory protein
MATSRLLSHEDLVAKGVPYSRVTLWRLEKQGKFPKRVPISPARFCYVESEIDAYVEALIAARDAGCAPVAKATPRRRRSEAPAAA